MNAPISTSASHSPASGMFSTTGTLPSPTPAPLHDIVGPLPFFSYTTTEIISAIFIFLFLAALIFWGLHKLRQKPPLTPAQKALQVLLSLNQHLMEGNDHEFGILVSGVLREYLEHAFNLAAPRQTTEEFLESLRNHNRFTSAEQESLRTFLSRSDFLKFAHGHASEEERQALIQAAEQFVQTSMLPQPINEEVSA